MICPHCSKTIKMVQVAEHRGKGLQAELRCYHCEAWIAKSARLAKLKMLGFYTALGLSIYCYVAPEFRHIGIPGVILAIMLLLVSHFMDHPYVVEAPEKTDDSDQRQKYR